MSRLILIQQSLGPDIEHDAPSWPEQPEGSRRGPSRARVEGHGELVLPSNSKQALDKASYRACAPGVTLGQVRCMSGDSVRDHPSLTSPPLWYGVELTRTPAAVSDVTRQQPAEGCESSIPGPVPLWHQCQVDQPAPVAMPPAKTTKGKTLATTTIRC